MNSRPHGGHQGQSWEKHRARKPRNLTPRVWPRVGPRECPRGCPRGCPRTFVSLFKPFEDFPRKAPRNVPRGCPRKRPRKCPRKRSVFTCPVFTCSVRCPNLLAVWTLELLWSLAYNHLKILKACCLRARRQVHPHGTPCSRKCWHTYHLSEKVFLGKIKGTN